MDCGWIGTIGRGFAIDSILKQFKVKRIHVISFDICFSRPLHVMYIGRTCNKMFSITTVPC